MTDFSQIENSINQVKKRDGRVSDFQYIILTLVISFSMSSVFADDSHITIVGDTLASELTVISLLIATSSFILGILLVPTFTARQNKYKVIIHTLILPALVLIIHGLVLISSNLSFVDHEFIFGILLVPVAAILLLTWWR